MYNSERNYQIIDFNANNKPWRINTTSILHDNNSILGSNSVNENNLVIESKTSNINFFVKEDKSINFYGKTVFNDEIRLLNSSIIEFQDLCCNNITVNNDISINGNLYLNNISIENMNAKLTTLESSYNELIFIMDRLGINI